MLMGILALHWKLDTTIKMNNVIHCNITMVVHRFQIYKTDTLFAV